MTDAETASAGNVNHQMKAHKRRPNNPPIHHISTFVIQSQPDNAFQFSSDLEHLTKL